MPMRWNGREDGAHWTTVAGADGDQIRIAIKQIPYGGWDWVACLSHHPEFCWSGVSETSDDALSSGKAAGWWLVILLSRFEVEVQAA